MPGPRSKAKKAKKTQKLEPKQELDRFEHLVDDIDGAEGWNAIVSILCDYFQLPDLTTRSGLKKLFTNFDVFYRRLDNAYEANIENDKMTGGIIGIFTKMCADSILRTKLFEKGLLMKIMPLINKPLCRHLALRALTTVTHHGGAEVRREIAVQATPTLLGVLQDYPDDLKAAELAIRTLAHSIGSLINVADKPDIKDIKRLNVPTMIRLVTGFVRRPGVTVVLVHHAIELLTHPTLHFWKDCKAYLPMVSLLVASLRSTDLLVRSMALGGLLRLEAGAAEVDQRFNDPQKFIASIRRKFPQHLSDIMMNYGPDRCDISLTLYSYVDNQDAFMQYAQDQDLYALAKKLAGFITKNEFSITDGGFQTQNPHTGRMEEMDLGLPFKRWADALPHCAKIIREKGCVGEEDLADMLDMKHFVIKSRIPEAVALARKAIERNPRFPYFYYIITLGTEIEEGLRFAKKGMKCKNITPFVRFAMMQRAVEIAGDLGVCRLLEAQPGDQKWEEGIAFIVSSLDDAKTYISEAPPDARHMKNVLYWYIVLTLVVKGPSMSPGLTELQDAIHKLQTADEFGIFSGTIPPNTQLRLTQQTVVKLYSSATEEWGPVIAHFDSLAAYDSDHQGQSVISAEKAEDDLAAWLDEMRLDDGAQDESCIARCSHPRIRANSVELYRCSYCGNPSAVLRKCSGCAKARYCDNSCQKSHWSEHKIACKV
ncbi:hypothetical protein SERLADRAFT_359379 [Serpula lacrymans var. lacrymans S7.9]|uniref:MYND-type domain-containing protein n=1 Tax=Serpula lacrymans var. lacrymans (strain S7.9) TaxID=578457 RepID=F8NHQ1_SERL9|nr:uncharacterized protein SERLADRAFT_359379 [Serpula lacrymans var. lacrymans S7.9]EGO29215.1 hypothetical protein SERLADRAFT_359379 [Serpula lacrymans var. lacrymans S7.9]